MSGAPGSPDIPAYRTAALVRRLLGLAWQYRGGCLRVLALQTTLLVLGLSGLGLMGLGIDFVKYHALRLSGPAAPAGFVAKPPSWPGGWTPPESWPVMGVLAAVASAILLFALVRSVLNYFYTVAVTRLVQARIVVDLRSRVYDKMQRLSFRFFDAHASSSIINRVTGDVQSVRLFVDGVAMQSVILLLSLAVYVVYMSGIHAGLTLACLATTPLLWVLTSRFSRAVQPAYAMNRELVDGVILRLSENVQGVHVVKGFARQADEVRRFEAASAAVRDQKHWIFDRVSTFQPLIGLVAHLNLVVLIGYGGYLVIGYEQAPAGAAAAGLSVGQLLVFAGLLQQVAGQVANIANIANSMQQSLTGARRVFEVLDLPVDIVSPPHPVRLDPMRGAVDFDAVRFRYQGGEPVLDGVTFSAPPGACVAVVGATGSGKSTLLSLIPRFYDPEEGAVRVDGVDVRRLDVNDLRRRIGIVFQESFLFSASVAANIAFGHPEATRAQVERAARVAAAHDFISALPRGYDTVLHEGGSNLSGGQRQRLAIARAVLLEPAILLLDDPTAAIDPQTEEEILLAMDGAMAGRTTFVVAHRLSTLRRAELILVLDKGRIVQTGTHEELLGAEGQYRWAATLQAADRESLRLLGEGP